MRVEGDDRLFAALLTLQDSLGVVAADLLAGKLGAEDRHRLSVVMATLSYDLEQGARAGDATERDSAASPARLDLGGPR